MVKGKQNPSQENVSVTDFLSNTIAIIVAMVMSDLEMEILFVKANSMPTGKFRQCGEETKSPCLFF